MRVGNLVGNTVSTFIFENADFHKLEKTNFF